MITRSVMNSIEISPHINNLAHICRLCLNVNKNLFQLFGPDETDAFAISLPMKISLCTALSISKNDNLPQKICHKCLNWINEWYVFRKRARAVHSFLKGKLLMNKDTTNVENKEMSEKPENSENRQLEEELKFNLNSVPLETRDDIILPSTARKKHKCPVCPDSFYFMKDLKSHKALLHSFIKSDTSHLASQIADSDTKLEGINMRTRYEMKCCGKIFFSKLKFRRHYNEKHPGEKPFMCETCGKKDFISEETLKRHKILHSGKFRCDVCQKTFTCNAILTLHKRDKHENDKPFICDVCGKRFVTELLMNYHKRFHTGEKKYVCEECGLAVVTSSSLAKHKRIHRQEKPHVCHVCGKGFIIKGRLVEHLRVHTGERPYSCQICQKGFTIRDKLKRHLRIHSGEKLFSCEFCGNSYSTKYGLLGHLKTHSV